MTAIYVLVGSEFKSLLLKTRFLFGVLRYLYFTWYFPTSKPRPPLNYMTRKMSTVFFRYPLARYLLRDDSGSKNSIQNAL